MKGMHFSTKNAHLLNLFVIVDNYNSRHLARCYNLRPQINKLTIKLYNVDATNVLLGHFTALIRYADVDITCMLLHVFSLLTLPYFSNALKQCLIDFYGWL